MKIRKRLALAAASSLVPVLIGFFVISVVAQNSDRRKTVALIDEYVGGAQNSLSLFFMAGRDVANYLASMQGRLMLEWSEASDVFEDFCRLNDYASEITFIDSEGYIYMSGRGNPWQGGRRTQNDSDPNSAPISAATRDYFRALVLNNSRGEPQVIVNEPYVPLGLTDKTIVTSVAVVHEGRAVGVVNVDQTTAALAPFYANITSDFLDKFGQNAHLFMISDGGQLVSSFRYNERTRAYEETLFNLPEIVSVSALDPSAVAAFNTAARAREVITAPIEGETFFVSSVRIEGTPFTLCFAAQQSTMLASSRIIRVISVIMFVINAIALFSIILSMTGSMVKALVAMRGTMQEIAAGGGDLTARLEVRGSDEITEISASFNQFIETLHGMMSNVSASAATLDSVGNTLSKDANEISSDVSTIHKEIESLNFSAEEQSASVTETSATITQIAQNIESLTSQIENETAAVTQSSAAVQQMVANIDSISKNISKASDSFDELKSDAAGGKNSISAVHELVDKLTAQSDSLLEANSVIDNIASQTNLLAMNAAIEAAHAGDAGKGFSVVAEEIRELAENSSEQSRAIAAGLKATIESIRNIAAATKTADGAFDNVASKIVSASALVNEINLAMSEQKEGSRQVLEALRDIENVTLQIRDGAVEMNSGTATILKEVTRLSNIAQQVQDRSSSISKAVDAINKACSEVVESSNANKEAVGVLVDITGKFVL